MILHAELNKNLKVGGTAGSSKYTPGHTLEMPQSYWIYPAPLCQTPKNAQISNDFQSHQTIQDIWASTVLSFIFFFFFTILLHCPVHYSAGFQNPLSAFKIVSGIWKVKQTMGCLSLEAIPTWYHWPGFLPFLQGYPHLWHASHD